MQFKRPLTQIGAVELRAGVPAYSLANYPDFAAYKTHLWGGCMPKPWEAGYPGALPRVEAMQDEEKHWWLQFNPAPTWKHVGSLGATFRFWYFGRHVLSSNAEETTIDPADRGLLILRAQAEAMRQMAIRNSGKPVSMRDGVSGMPRNSTPEALHKSLLAAFREAR